MCYDRDKQNLWECLVRALTPATLCSELSPDTFCYNFSHLEYNILIVGRSYFLKSLSSFPKSFCNFLVSNSPLPLSFFITIVFITIVIYPYISNLPFCVNSFYPIEPLTSLLRLLPHYHYKGEEDHRVTVPKGWKGPWNIWPNGTQTSMCIWIP